MGKSTKTYEERIQEKDLRIEKLAQELKRYEAQKKQLEKRKKVEERKIRTHRLIEIGAAVESVLGRCIELEEIPLFDVQKLKSPICSMQSTIAEQGQEIQKLNAHIARLAESDLVLVENQKLIKANQKLQV